MKRWHLLLLMLTAVVCWQISWEIVYADDNSNPDINNDGGDDGEGGTEGDGGDDDGPTPTPTPTPTQDPIPPGIPVAPPDNNPNLIIAQAGISQTVGTFDVIGGPKYRKIALNGLPLSDEKPQNSAESDEEPEESYIDALTLQLNHSTTDIYIPLPGGELSLSVRRNAVPEIFNGRSITQPTNNVIQPDPLTIPYNAGPIQPQIGIPFGANWSSNLTPAITLQLHQAPLTPPQAIVNSGSATPQLPYIIQDTATVVDENGNSYRFAIINSTTATTYPTFYPYPSSRDEQDVMQCTLVQVSASNYVFIRKYGTKLTYQLDSTLTQTNPDDVYSYYQDLASGSGAYPGTTTSIYSRLQTVNDRFGNSLNYTYPTQSTLIPSKIQAADAQNNPLQSITIALSATYPQQVGSVTDARGFTHTYSYGTLTGQPDTYNYNDQPAVTGGGGQAGVLYVPIVFTPQVTVLNSVTAPPLQPGSAAPVTTYGYTLYKDTDFSPPPYQWDGNSIYKTIPNDCEITSITDPNNNTYQFSYSFDRTRLATETGDLPAIYTESGLPMNVTGIILPNQAQVTLGNDSSATTPFQIGPVGTAVATSMTHVIDATGVYRSYDFGNADFYPTSFSQSGGSVSTTSVQYLRAYSSLKISYYAGNSPQTALMGTETFHFNEQANMALASVIDFSGNTTTYTQSDLFVPSAPVFSQYPAPGYSLYYSDPNSETTALGFTTKYTYTPGSLFRIMTSSVEMDNTGNVQRSTLDTVDPTYGLRTEEDIVDAGGTTEQTTQFYYQFNDPNFTGPKNFPSFLTRSVKLNFTNPAANLETDSSADSLGRVAQQIVDPNNLALTSSFTYDANNNKLTSTDPNNHTTSFTYDPLNQLTQVTNPDQTTKLTTYDPRGNPIVETDENGHQTLLTYDSLNRLVTSTRVLSSGNLVTQYGYNNVNSKTSVTDPNGNVTQMSYDSLQRLIQTIDPYNKSTTYAYGTNSGGNPFDESSFKPTHMVDRLGYATDVQFDADYRETSTSAQYSLSPVLTSTTTKQYDIFNNVTQVTDPLSHISVTSYDALDRAISTTVAFGTPLAATTTMVYNSLGEESQLTDPLGRTTLYKFDTAGRKTDLLEPFVDNGSGQQARPQTHNTYDNVGNTVGTINPLGNKTAFQYDSRNRKIAELEPPVADASNGNAVSRPTTTWTYDGVGNDLTKTDPRGFVTTKVYDEANRVLSTTEATGTTYAATTQMVYDADGNVVQAIDPLLNTTTNVYDKLNRLTSTTDPQNITVSSSYDAEGNKLTVTDGKSQVTTFTFDGLKRNLTVSDPDNNTTTLVYDALNKTQRIDALNQVTNYSYDARNRLSTVTYVNTVNPASNFEQDYAYDNVSNQLSVTEPNNAVANVANTYDALNRVITESSGGLTHTYTYDLANNRLSTVYGGTNRTIISTYDVLNRLTAMTETGRISQYSYDLNGNIIIKTSANGDTETRIYDGLNRDTTLLTNNASSTLEYQDITGYDLASNVTSTQEIYPGSTIPTRTVTNAYDADYRLLTETSAITSGATTVTRYTYDTANNRSTKSVSIDGAAEVTTHYIANNLNQIIRLSSAGSVIASFTYDANGNRTTETQGSATNTYVYDAENRLVTVGQNTGPTPANGTYNYQYDYRTRRILRDESQAGGASTQIIYSGGESVQEYDNRATTPTVEYLRGSDYGGGVGGILYTLRSGSPSYTHTNKRGDITAKSNSSGSLTYLAQYQAFGNQVATYGSTLDRQKSNSKDTDPTGLVDEGMRYYDLLTETFITRDPAGMIDGPNEYTYVKQNPWTHFDPEGLNIAEAPEAACVLVEDAGVLGEDVVVATFETTETATQIGVDTTEYITQGVIDATEIVTQKAIDTELADLPAQVRAVKSLTSGTPKPEPSTPPGNQSAQTVVKKPYSNPDNRPKYGKGQQQEVWDQAVKKSPDGVVRDPNTGKVLEWKKTDANGKPIPRKGQWDMGHKKGFEYNKLHSDYMNGKMSTKDFLKEYRDPKNYVPEDPATNQSHQFEDKPISPPASSKSTSNVAILFSHPVQRQLNYLNNPCQTTISFQQYV